MGINHDSVRGVRLAARRCGQHGFRREAKGGSRRGSRGQVKEGTAGEAWHADPPSGEFEALAEESQRGNRSLYALAPLWISGEVDVQLVNVLRAHIAGEHDGIVRSEARPDTQACTVGSGILNCE